MSPLIIVQPVPIATVTSSTGTGASNLRTRDPKEVWAAGAVGTSVLQIDLGRVVTIDTIVLGYLAPVTNGATWSIKGGAASPDDGAIQGVTPLHAADSPAASLSPSHALWRGGAVAVRYLAITVTQPAGAGPLTAGFLVFGKAFSPELGHEWGAGRQPIDTGTSTSLPSGGFAVVEGVRKRLCTWTFGDLSRDETAQLEQIALELGSTAPGIAIEQPDVPEGLRRRIHYGLFQRWKPFERRNKVQTRWEITIEEWA